MLYLRVMPGHLDVAVSQSETAAWKHLVLLLEVRLDELMMGNQQAEASP